MTLAGMISTDEALLICDMAETYGIYDYKRLPARTAAMLAAGLRENSRIRQKMEGVPAEINTILLASITDRLGLILSALAGADTPESVVDSIYGHTQKKKSNIMSFDSLEEFRKRRYG